MKTDILTSPSVRRIHGGGPTTTYQRLQDWLARSSGTPEPDIYPLDYGPVIALCYYWSLSPDHVITASLSGQVAVHLRTTDPEHALDACIRWLADSAGGWTLRRGGGGGWLWHNLRTGYGTEDSGLCLPYTAGDMIDGDGALILRALPRFRARRERGPVEATT